MTSKVRIAWIAGLLLLLALGRAAVFGETGPGSGEGSPAAGPPPPQIAVSPSRFEVELGEAPATGSLRLLNLGDEAIAVSTSVGTWDLDEENRVRQLPPGEQTLDQWMVVNPLRFTIPPRSTQIVRFSIRPRVEPAPGEHRAMIYFNQELPEGSGRQLRVRFSLGVAVYAYRGEIVRVGSLESVQATADGGPPQVALRIASTGTAAVRLKGTYAVRPAGGADPGAGSAGSTAGDDIDGAPVQEDVLASGDLPNIPVLPGTRREVLLPMAKPLPPGSYALDLHGSLGDAVLDGTYSFTLDEPGSLLTEGHRGGTGG